MKKTELESLISSMMLGAKQAREHEERARADWSALCHKVPGDDASDTEYSVAMTFYNAALGALQESMKRVDAFAEPFCRLLPMFDLVSTLQERIALLGIDESHFGSLSESSGCLWMVASQMETPRDVVDLQSSGLILWGSDVVLGPVYASLHRHLMSHRDLITADHVDLAKQFPFGVTLAGITSWGVADGGLLREWKPFEYAEDWELEAAI